MTICSNQTLDSLHGDVNQWTRVSTHTIYQTVGNVVVVSCVVMTKVIKGTRVDVAISRLVLELQRAQSERVFTATFRGLVPVGIQFLQKRRNCFWAAWCIKGIVPRIFGLYER